MLSMFLSTNKKPKKNTTMHLKGMKLLSYFQAGLAFGAETYFFACNFGILLVALVAADTYGLDGIGGGFAASETTSFSELEPVTC